MNLDLYSDRAKQAVQSAQSLALARRHQQFAPEHLLKVLLEERDVRQVQRVLRVWFLNLSFENA